MFLSSNKNCIFFPKEYQLLVKGIYPFSVRRGGRSSFLYFFSIHIRSFWLSISILKLPCAKNTQPHHMCFLEIILSWRLSFREVDQKLNLSPFWTLLPVVPTPCRGSPETSHCRQALGGPVSHPPTWVLRRRPLPLFFKSLGSRTLLLSFNPWAQEGVSGELEMSGHFFRLLPGKRGQERQVHRHLIFFTRTLSPQSHVQFSSSRESSRDDFWLWGGLGIWK